MCEATTQYMFKDNNDEWQYQPCSARAKINVCGVNLCIIHAGRIAIRKLIALGHAEILPSDYCSMQDRENCF
jgi:hypothetical protein